MYSVKRVAASIGALFAVGVAPIASAAIDPVSAIADGTLKFTGFAFTSGGSSLCQVDPALNSGVCRVNGSGTPIVYVLNGNETADSSVSLNGTALPQVSTSTGLGATFVAASGLGPSYVAPTVAVPVNTGQLGSQNGTPNTTTGPITSLVSGGTSWSNGNSLLGSADVVIQSQVVLNGPGQVGSAQVNQNLSTEFLLQSLGGSPLSIDLDFTATRFWRGALGQAGILAKGSTNFAITIDIVEDSNGIFNSGGSTIGENVLTFAPTLNQPLGLGGLCNDDGYCSATIPFALTGSREAPNGGGDTFDGAGQANKVRNGAFNISIDLPELTNPLWYYKFTITGGAVADAETPVPAPGVLALLGMGLLAFGVSRRRQSNV